jgi:hypothetical protein
MNMYNCKYKVLEVKSAFLLYLGVRRRANLSKRL